MSSRALVPIWLCAVLLSPTLASAEESRGIFLGDEWRYVDRGAKVHLLVLDLVERVGADLVSITTGPFTTWDRGDFAGFIGVSAAVLTLMAGDSSYDAQLDDWIHARLGQPLAPGRFTVWTPLSNGVIWATIFGIVAASLVVGLVVQHSPLVEVCVLMAEALAVAQVFHLTTKILLGREGPDNGTGRGLVLGPAAGLRLFPSGTPSGHAASLYALMGVAARYWDNPWLTGALQLFGFIFCGTLLVDDYHFASDLIWGASMGWAIGTFVVDHRSTKRPSGATVTFHALPVVDLRHGMVALTAGLDF